ncbi:MAG: sodium:proton antiporter NhaD [Flavobacteriales bacterium]|nr:MAG: sodium:proton antiporter NhaD [Flavobacteriales bacterium]
MSTLLIIVFVLGYAAIAFEHTIKVNKAASALITGAVLWAVLAFGGGGQDAGHDLSAEIGHHMSEISGILFFLLGAMTIVELIAAHNGFDLVTARISTSSKRGLMWTVGLITFFLSAVLDNLTTTIVMVTLLRKLIANKEERMWAVGIVIIAANAGGAWSPIGDVTTTMLWIKGQVTTAPVILHLILPSLACLAVPLVLANHRLRGKMNRPEGDGRKDDGLTQGQRTTVLVAGVAALLLVPVFKTVTHLPPFVGILLMLGLLWLLTEIMHGGKDDEFAVEYTVVHALRKVDSSSVLFFLGILLSISALQTAGILTDVATGLSAAVPDVHAQAILIGLTSAVVDNVPLVAAAQGMYAGAFPTDHTFWIFLAYCAGTGGSALIIGSAAGVAAMGMEKIGFFWYLKKMTGLALAGYLAGVAVYLLQNALF